MSNKYHVKRREFLNLHTDMRAYIIAIVEDAREKKIGEGSDYCSEINLRISDCADEIELYFDLCTAEERENSLHKVRILAEVIHAFKTGN